MSSLREFLTKYSNGVINIYGRFEDLEPISTVNFYSEWKGLS